MSTVVDHRIADRRMTVKEDGARRRLRRLLIALLLIGLGAFGGWLLYHSSFLAVSEITVDGQVASQAGAILAERGVVPGVPTINVRPEDIESALIEDPWVASASVRVTWPGSVTVQVLEHEPVGWIRAGDRWLLASASGVVLSAADEPQTGMPQISVGSFPAEPGEQMDAGAVAALTFVVGLPDELAADAFVSGSSDELAGVIAGHQTVLGYPSDMAAKAAALAALLESGVPHGAEINLVSPERPGVMSKPLVESSSEVMGESQPTG